ncbi:MAG: hypothetical protein AW11_00753 [Candidatus Accumulibacter regalis]|uniref:Uncharacterized protein n=1 Tax=Accumulibacter regalis TaxID=522306 RepID=A0A011P601_ACCRE|nr:MAG: hypothetical protein AW11_00753 [Candidatus Accumulibacter regalis]
MPPEQATEHRNVTEEGQLARRPAVLVADQSGEQLVLAVLETQDAGRRARADPISDGTRLGLHPIDDIAHLEGHLDGHFVVEVDRRFDVQLEADIDVGDRLGDKAGRRGRRSDVGHPFANQDLGFLAVARANARIGQQIDVGVGLVGADHDRSDGGPDGRRVEIAQVVQGQRSAARRRQRSQCQRVRPVDAQVAKSRTLDLEDLHFEHHFGLRHILQGNQLLGDANRFRAVANHEQIQLLVNHHILALEDCLQRGGDGLGVGIGQVEGLHRQRLVVTLFHRRVRVDQDRVAIEDTLFELVGQQHQVDRRLDAAVAQENGDFLIGAQILVENEVQPGGARNHFENGFQRCIPELDGDRFAVGRFQHRLLGDTGTALVNDAQQFQRAFVAGVGGEDLAQARARRGGVAPAPRGQRFAVQDVVATCRVHQLQADQRPLVTRLQRQRASKSRPGGVVARFRQGPFAVVEAGIDVAFLRPRIGNAILGGAWFEGDRVLNPGQPGIDLFGRKQLLAFGERRLRGTACQQQRRSHAQAAPPPACRSALLRLLLAHDGDPPMEMVCDCFSGR